MTELLIAFGCAALGLFSILRELTAEDRAYRRAIRGALSVRVGLTR